MPMWIPLLLTFLSTMAAANQQRGQAKIIESSAAAEAKRAKRAAEEKEAVGQKQAAHARRKAEIEASRALAVAAAGGTSGQGIEDLYSGILEEGEREAGYAEYEGVTGGQALRDRASLGLWEGGVNAKTSRIAARNTVLQGVAQGASIYSRYSGGDPAPTLHGNNFADADTGSGIYSYGDR